MKASLMNWWKRLLIYENIEKCFCYMNCLLYSTWTLEEPEIRCQEKYFSSVSSLPFFKAPLNVVAMKAGSQRKKLLFPCWQYLYTTWNLSRTWESSEKIKVQGTTWDKKEPSKTVQDSSRQADLSRYKKNRWETSQAAPKRTVENRPWWSLGNIP